MAIDEKKLNKFLYDLKNYIVTNVADSSVLTEQIDAIFTDEPQQKEPVKIEELKIYKTRNGNRAIILWPVEFGKFTYRGIYMGKGGSLTYKLWDKSGFYVGDSDEHNKYRPNDSPYDCIELIEEVD